MQRQRIERVQRSAALQSSRKHLEVHAVSLVPCSRCKLRVEGLEVGSKLCRPGGPVLALLWGGNGAPVIVG